MVAQRPLSIGHLLVPLDGSRLSEATLPVAVSVAAKTGARVTLLHVRERRAPATIHGDRHLRDLEEANRYLDSLVSRHSDASIPVETHVHSNPEGDVAASIAEHASEFHADMIILCTHGHGGMRSWLFGSLAQQVLRRQTPPVLLIRPASSGAKPAVSFSPRTVAVALDGSTEAEAALPSALALANAFGADLLCVATVATLGTVSGDRAATARLIPAATTAALDAEEQEMVGYLDDLQGRIGEGGTRSRSVIGRGEPVRTLIEIVEGTPDGLLALATHGRGAFDALWSASVGSKVVGKTTMPMLLIHPGRGALDKRAQ